MFMFIRQLQSLMTKGALLLFIDRTECHVGFWLLHMQCGARLSIGCFETMRKIVFLDSIFIISSLISNQNM